MDYCHMIYHVNANNFVTVSISTIGVEILAMTSLIASHVRVTCFNDVISRHLTPFDLSVPTVGTWKPNFGFFFQNLFFHNKLFQKWKCLPLWQLCVSDWNTKISKVYHIKIQPAWTRNFICLLPRPIRYQIKYQILIVQLWRKMISVFSHSW